MSKQKKENIPEKIEEETFTKKKIMAQLSGERVLSDDVEESRELYNSSRFGEPFGKKFQYSLIEALFLLEKEKFIILDEKKELNMESFIKRARKVEPNFWVRYCTYKDLRKRGYIVKTALKFGADFRVYDRGIKPGEDHAKWIVYPVHEGDTLTWYEFAAKNRVAHSTRKRLLLAVVDEEGDVSFWECRWIRP